MADAACPPHAPGVEPLLVEAAGVGVVRDVDAVDPGPGDFGDEGAQGRLVEVGEPATTAHAVVCTHASRICTEARRYSCKDLLVLARKCQAEKR